MYRNLVCAIVVMSFVFIVHGLPTPSDSDNMKKDCPEQCGYNHQPVCGHSNDGRYQTFSSECEYKKVACRQPYAAWSMQEGECKSNMNGPSTSGVDKFVIPVDVDKEDNIIALPYFIEIHFVKKH